jgi:hypothetical protein
MLAYVFSTVPFISGLCESTIHVKSYIFRDVTPCSLVKVSQHFKGAYHHCLQVQSKLSKKPA